MVFSRVLLRATVRPCNVLRAASSVRPHQFLRAVHSVRTTAGVMPQQSLRAAARLHSSARSSQSAWTWGRISGAASAVAIAAFGTAAAASSASKVEWAAVRKAIEDQMDDDNYEDGSRGPVLVRLAWHASGTYNKADGTGGSDGATMRFCPEANHGGNSGLAIARAFLEPIKKQFPGASYADIWSLAGAVAIEYMGGPKIAWRAGRTDKPDGTTATPDGRLPDASQGPQHLRDIFYRMGFNDQEIVALSGAHSLGRCHDDRSGFHGPWTRAPTTFSNLYFQELLNNTWTVRKWNGPKQYQDPSDTLMMLPSDMALIEDDKFKKWVEVYAKDDARFRKDFAQAFQKLQELGCKNLEGKKKKFGFF